jgi:hypothetical protein
LSSIYPAFSCRQVAIGHTELLLDYAGSQNLSFDNQYLSKFIFGQLKYYRIFWNDNSLKQKFSSLSIKVLITFNFMLTHAFICTLLNSDIRYLVPIILYCQRLLSARINECYKGCKRTLIHERSLWSRPELKYKYVIALSHIWCCWFGYINIHHCLFLRWLDRKTFLVQEANKAK